MPLEWTANYETGESRLDRQHRQLFGDANQLEGYLDRFQAGDPPDPKDIGVFLSFVETHLYLHLTYEELLLRRSGHAAAANETRATHARLEAYAQGFRARAASQGLTLPLLEELLHVMYTWLPGHVRRASRWSLPTSTAAPTISGSTSRHWQARRLPHLPQAG